MSKHMKTGFEGKKGLAVDVRGNNFDAALRLFSRKVKREGLMRELRAREFYEQPSVVRRRKHAEALLARASHVVTTNPQRSE
jgi:small subunit ribosomal protein S21